MLLNKGACLLGLLGLEASCQISTLFLRELCKLLNPIVHTDARDPTRISLDLPRHPV